jgi:hypothetical protein
MPDSAAIDTALVDKLLADSALMAYAPDGVFFDAADKSIATGGDAKRFILISLANADDEPMFGGTAFEDALYLVKFVALASTTTSANARAAAARLQALLHFQPLTIPGYGLMVMRRVARVRLLEIDGVDKSIRWFHRGGRYQVMAAPTST